MISKFKWIYFLSLLVLIIIFSFESCSPKEIESQEFKTIQVDLKRDDIGKIFIQEVIQPESSAESIFGRVSRICLINNKVFILDKGRSEIYLFNKNGEFLKKTERGKGPGELLSPTDFYVDIDNNYILVFDFDLQKLIKYDLELNYLSSNTFPETRVARWFDRFQDDKWLVHYQNPLRQNGSKIYSYLIYSSDFGEIIDSLMPSPITDYRKLSMYNPISRNNYVQLFCRPFDQRVYAINQDEIITKYYFDFGSKNILQADMENGLKYTLGLLRAGKRLSILGDLINSNKYLAVSFSYKKQADYLIYSKQSGKVRCSIPSKSLPYGSLKGMVNDSTFILMVEPDTFLGYLEESGLDKNFYGEINPAGNDIMLSFILDES